MLRRGVQRRNRELAPARGCLHRVKLLSPLLWTLAAAVVALVGYRAQRAPEAPALPRPGEWASTPLICREGALTVIDARSGREDRMTWTPAGGEAWRGDERVRSLTSAEVQAVLTQLEPLDNRHSDLFSCDRFMRGTPNSLTVFRHCDAANRTLEVTPAQRHWGLDNACGEPRCGGSGLEFLSCVLQENWVETRRTNAYDRAELFARRFRAAL